MLDDRTVVVTGGSLGVGRAIALEAAGRGARVVLAARHEGPLRDCLRDLPPVSGGEHLWQVVDVADPASVEAFATWCGQRLERLDGLINSAGVYGPIGRLEDISVEEFLKALRVNLVGTVHMTQVLLPLLRRSRRGKVVNLSGGGAASPFPRYSAYACSKVAVARFTENLAHEYPELDVNCLAPGFVVTRLHQETLAAGPERAGQAFFEKTRQEVAGGGVPARRAAELACFLLSPQSDGISGRFLAAPWDPWEDPGFQERLRREPHLATLRRIDDRGFTARP
ncbi:MAG TPA: SDR family oxidoreductase [Candidatus Nitrosotenuis sp.]|jgi:3-oxoacyl-[acyl-carrier protein] reductase|nr:SDR family oxidoreductase [Candidatus Nitrosotenuis sp.]